MIHGRRLFDSSFCMGEWVSSRPPGRLGPTRGGSVQEKNVALARLAGIRGIREISFHLPTSNNATFPPFALRSQDSQDATAPSTRARLMTSATNGLAWFSCRLTHLANPARVICEIADL